jgi:hypothetical protein
MGTAIEPGFLELLEQVGAVPPRHGRGKWRCPECGRPDLSVNLEKQVFHCFHAGCSFSGGMGTLRQRLGIERQRLPKAEYIRQCRECERVHDAALRLYAAAKLRRFELYDQLRVLGRIEVGAHDCGPTEAAWSALALVYSEPPRILAELAILENANAAGLARFLTADDAAHGRRLRSPLMWKQERWAAHDSGRCAGNSPGLPWEGLGRRH